MSLSPVRWRAGILACSAAQDRVAITSSASYPGIARQGIPNTSRISATRGICRASGSGIGFRVALYAGYSSWRTVGPGVSSATATYRAGWSRRTLSRVRTNP